MIIRVPRVKRMAKADLALVMSKRMDGYAEAINLIARLVGAVKGMRKNSTPTKLLNNRSNEQVIRQAGGELARANQLLAVAFDFISRAGLGEAFRNYVEELDERSGEGRGEDGQSAERD